MRNLLISILLISLLGCASGAVMVTGSKRPATTWKDVKLYYDPPEKYEVIGIVMAESKGSLQSRIDRALWKLQLYAATVGANGVLVNTKKIDSSNAGSSGAFMPVGNQGHGIYVSNSNRMTEISGKAIWVE